MRKSLGFSLALALAATGCEFYPRGYTSNQGYQGGPDENSPCAFPQQPQSCTLDLDCAGYQICIQGGCQLACAGQGDCYFDQTCNPNGGFCVCTVGADGGATATGGSGTATGSSSTGSSTGSATGSSSGSSTGGATTAGSSSGGGTSTGSSTAGSGTGGGTT